MPLTDWFSGDDKLAAELGGSPDRLQALADKVVKLRRALKQVVGIPDYEIYLARHKVIHPGHAADERRRVLPLRHRPALREARHPLLLTRAVAGHDRGPVPREGCRACLFNECMASSRTALTARVGCNTRHSMGLLDWLLGMNDEAAGTSVAADILEQRTEQVVAMIDPRLKLVPGYQRKLAPAVEQSVLYCRGLEAQLPPVIETSAAAWSTNPLLRALFATAQDIPAVFSRSAELQQFFVDSPGADEAWVMLRFVRNEEKGFGVVVHGSVVQHDVARTSVSFGEKAAIFPSASEHDARIGIRRRAFKFLVTQALEQITSVDTQRADLREQHSMLKARLSILKGQHIGLEAMLGNGEATSDKIEEVERKLSENEQSLGKFPGVGEGLDYAMGRVQEVLAHASDYLQVRTVKLRLDQMNVMVPEASPEPATEITLPEVMVKGKPALHVIACRFARSEIIRRGQLLEQAQRLLG